MYVDVCYEGIQQFRAIARDHTAFADQSIEDGGTNQGMTPCEWLLSALGSCVGTYAVQYLQCRGLDSTGLRVRVAARTSPVPVPRLDDIVIHVSLPTALDSPDCVGLQRAVEVCELYNTLTYVPKIKTRITAGPDLVG